MIFITYNRKLHLFDNFWMFKTQILKITVYMKKIIYIKNSKRLWKYVKTKQKTTAF